MRAGKNDFNEVFVYAAIVAMLLGWRVWNHWAKARRRVSSNSLAGNR
jgi:sulfoxide reductase heme-binding subunit YedZ